MIHFYPKLVLLIHTFIYWWQQTWPGASWASVSCSRTPGQERIKPANLMFIGKPQCANCTWHDSLPGLGNIKIMFCTPEPILLYTGRKHNVQLFIFLGCMFSFERNLTHFTRATGFIITGCESSWINFSTYVRKAAVDHRQWASSFKPRL